MFEQVIILFVLLLFSGFFSASELAFVVSNKLKIEIRARKNNIAAKNALYFVNNPNVLFSTILISNNIVNITFASLITVFLFDQFQLTTYSILAISTTLLLLLGELLPKYFAREFSDNLLITSVIPLRILSFALFPLVKITSSISNLLIRTKKIEEYESENIYDKEDIQTLLDEGALAGNMDENETDTINKIFELGEQKVYQSMTPRTDIVGVSIETSIDEVINEFVESGYSKIPVYSESLDNIKGIVYAYDMFSIPKSIEEVIHEVSFVPETKKSLEMLNEFLDQHVSIAIVVDEFGGTAGLITIEDLLEEMLGEIRDEYDFEEEVCKKINDNTFVISGKVETDIINENFDLNIPEGDYETLAGYITTNIGRIPKKLEMLEINSLSFEILHADRTKINLIKIYNKPESF